MNRAVKESVHRLESSNLDNERSIWIREPRNVAAATHLVVFLDAELYRDRVGAPAVIDGLREDIADSWFVFVSECSAEARRLECACYRPFSRFIAEELLPFLENSHIDVSRVRHRAIAGLSYTGLAAACVARDFPTAFERVICQSGSFWWNDCWLAEAFRHSQTRIPVEFYLDVGNGETQIDVDHGFIHQALSQVEGVRRLRDTLSDLGHSVVYHEFDGGHDYRCWQESLPKALRWCLPLAETSDPAGG